MYKGLRILLLCVVAMAFALSFWMLQRVIGFSSPWLAILLMFYFLGLAKVAEPLFNLGMPSGLQALRGWEREGAIEHKLGILAYGRFLRSSPLRYLNMAVYMHHDRRDLHRVWRLAQSGEAAHFWAALLLLPFIVDALYHGAWQVAAWFVLAELAVNVYPLLHLRYVRGRLERVLARRAG